MGVEDMSSNPKGSAPFGMEVEAEAGGGEAGEEKSKKSLVNAAAAGTKVSEEGGAESEEEDAEGEGKGGGGNDSPAWGEGSSKLSKLNNLSEFLRSCLLGSVFSANDL
jgi:hypothetical protein